VNLLLPALARFAMHAEPSALTIGLSLPGGVQASGSCKTDFLPTTLSFMFFFTT